MSDHHLSTGSTDVPLNPGKLRLYSMKFCPFAQRAHLVLDAKQIPYDTVWINLFEKPEWYLRKFSEGLVPALYLNGTFLYESLVICDYLDEKYPNRKLSSTDPLRKAQDRLVVDLFSKIGAIYYKALSELTDEVFEEVLKALEPIEKELATRGTKFFSGETRPGMVDYMIWPLMERIEVFEVQKGDKFSLPKDRLSKLTAWTAEMKTDATVKKRYISPEKHAEFIKLYKNRDPKCFDAVKV